jgi:monoamine oxidase
MGIVLKYLSSTPSRFWIPSALAPSSTSEAFGMTWEGTDNQIGREPEFSLFAGGAAAQAALDAYQRGGDAGVHAFYDSNIDGIYSGYSAAREQWPRFVPWPLEEWTRTGYACPAPGEVTRYGPLIDAAFRDRLWFAGEHTCLAFYGYMEGALQSGWRTADKILGR